MAGTIPDARILYSAIDLNPVEEREFEGAMEELPAILRHKPLQIDVSVARLEGKNREQVLDVLTPCDDITSRNADLLSFLCERFQPWPHVYLACSEQHELAQAAQRNNRNAVWGGALGPLALVYYFDGPCGIWHEALHLLGAKDCYSLPDPGPTCGLSHCIMQYEPRLATAATWPFICEKNVRRMQKRVKR